MIKIFTIYNGGWYIAQYSSGLKPTRNREEAIQFKTYDKASSFMLNMPKSFKNLGYHIEGKAETAQTTHKPSGHKKVIIQRDLSYIKEIGEEVSKIEFFISDLQRRRREAIEIVERCEREEQDFLHCSEGPDKNACDMFYAFVRMAVNEKLVKRRCSETKYVSTDYDKNDKLTVMVNEHTNSVLTSYSNFEIEQREKHGYEKVAAYSDGKLVEKYGKYKDWSLCA